LFPIYLLFSFISTSPPQDNARIVLLETRAFWRYPLCRSSTHWIEKYLLFRGTRSFDSLVTEGGFGSQDVRVAAVSQDLIGWMEFLHKKVSVEIVSIQHLHCMSSPSCRLTGKDWMKVFISLLIQNSHSQWIAGFLGRVVDLALYKTKILGSKPPPGGLSTNPRLTFVTFAPVSVHSPHISP